MEPQERNVLGGPLEICSTDPLTGYHRDGTCRGGAEDAASHSICAVMTAEFLEFQRQTGNDLTVARPQFGFPGLQPGDRWCVVAMRWQLAHEAGVAAPVVLAATSERTLQTIPLEVLRQHAVDVPDDISSLE